MRRFAVKNRWLYGLLLFPVALVAMPASLLRWTSTVFIASFLLWASVVDIKERAVYDWHTVSIFIVGAIASLAMDSWKAVLSGMGIGLLFVLVMKVLGRMMYGAESKELDYGFGDGDSFLIVALGAGLGLQIIPLFMTTLFSSFVVSIVLMATKRMERSDTIPLVPFIGFAYLFTVITNPDMSGLYPLWEFIASAI